MTPWETCHLGTANTICSGICLPEVVLANYLGTAGRGLGTTIPLPPHHRGPQALQQMGHNPLCGVSSRVRHLFNVFIGPCYTLVPVPALDLRSCLLSCLEIDIQGEGPQGVWK